MDDNFQSPSIFAIFIMWVSPIPFWQINNFEQIFDSIEILGGWIWGGLYRKCIRLIGTILTSHPIYIKHSSDENLVIIILFGIPG